MNVSPTSGLVILSDDVSQVVCSRHFGEEDALGLLSLSYHGHAWGHPFRFERDAFAAGAVDEDAGVSENNRRALLLKTELFTLRKERIPVIAFTQRTD